MTETTPPTGPTAVPNRLGPWTILSRVGAGGMGVVFQATRANLGDRVAALKVIRPGLLEDPAVQARFAREVEVLRRVRDVHISEFLDADLTSEQAWLATAFIDGPNLRDYVADNGPLPEQQWWALARGLAQALAVLEVHGVTHRDLKPANVILAAHGPVLIDFGIAVPEDAASLTGTGLVTGSPAWLSPEQANMKPVTPASDIFSLGSLLAFAGTGRPPFGAGAHVAMLLAISTRDPDTAGLSQEQHRLLAAMMAKDPADRPVAREVLSWSKVGETGEVPALHPPATDATVVAGGMSDTQVLQPEAAPAAPAVAAAAAAAGPPAAAHVTPAAGNPIAEPAAQPRRRWGWIPLLAVMLAVVIGGVWWLSRDGGGEDPIAGPDEPQQSASAVPTPPAPDEGDVAQSSDWVLSPWRVENNSQGQMSVSGTIQNRGDEAASGFATAFIYADGQAIGSASGELPEVPAGGSAEVTLVGEDPWAPGAKDIELVVQ